tara:strand:- start:344 stop:550 length:207 start_codon:yes stop_codon:yes gene_type:complete
MPIFNPAHISGRTIRPSMLHSGFNLMKDTEDKREAEPVEGSGLEKISDKLEKFIVKPRRKLKNIQFNP